MSHPSSMPIKPHKLQSLLLKAGYTIESKRSGSGHRTVRRGNRKTDLPFHGGGKDIGDRLVNKILTDPGLTRTDIGLD